MTLNGYIAFLTFDLALASICASALLRLSFVGNPRHQSLLALLELVLLVWAFYTAFSYLFLTPVSVWWLVLIAFAIYHFGLFLVSTDMTTAVVFSITQFIVISLLSFFLLVAASGNGIFLSLASSLAIFGLTIAAQKIYHAAFTLYGHEISDDAKEEIESIGELPGREASPLEKLFIKALATALVLIVSLQLFAAWY